MAEARFCPLNSDTRARKQLPPRSYVHCTQPPASWPFCLICVTNSCSIIVMHKSILFFSSFASVSSQLAHCSLEDLCAVEDPWETYCKCAPAFILSPTEQSLLSWDPSLPSFPFIRYSFASSSPAHSCFPSLSQSVSWWPLNNWSHSSSTLLVFISAELSVVRLHFPNCSMCPRYQRLPICFVTADIGISLLSSSPLPQSSRNLSIPCQICACGLSCSSPSLGVEVLHCK